ncbi:MAG: hypothetical protein C0392_14845 [Syntrophus sp. (in: bacteria)]|nr:hypothetical protein [Syntrophus sp. (in: bacteria)]
MLHRNKDDFVRTLNQVAMQTGFMLPLVEKDYYLTILLSRLHELSEDLVFKGGTCLNKIYFSYYRLSENLDFTMRLPSDAATRAMRRRCIEPEVLTLFQKKLEEDETDTDLARYSVNLGRSVAEIRDMKDRIEEELYEVLTPEERSRFDLDAALGRINTAFAGLG